MPGSSRRRIAVAAGIALLVVAPAATHAQGALVSVRGVAYDSLRRAPLADAMISVDDGAKTTTADSRGRFRIDSLSPGPHRFAMQHASLDSLGLSGIEARVAVTDGRDEIQLSIPSFESLWRAACGASKPPKDSGFVYGTIRDAHGRDAVAKATVDLSWVDIGVNAQKVITQRRWHNTSSADASGSYSVCGVPAGIEFRIRASTDSAVSGLIDMHPRASRIQRRDLLLGPLLAADSMLRGTIKGTLTTEAGGPVANARIIMDEAAEGRSEGDGSFIVRNVPAGTRQVEILSIGMTPYVAPVDVVVDETATFQAALHKMTTLDVVTVTGTARQKWNIRAIDERQRSGMGHTLDSTRIANHPILSSVFAEIPMVHVKTGRVGTKFQLLLPQPPGECLANLFVDGIRQLDQEDLGFIHPDEIAVIEAYTHGMSVPVEFQVPRSKCGAVAIWTKRAFR